MPHVIEREREGEGERERERERGGGGGGGGSVAAGTIDSVQIIINRGTLYYIRLESFRRMSERDIDII